MYNKKMKQIFINESQLASFIEQEKPHLRYMIEKFGRPNVILNQIQHKNMLFLTEELGIDMFTSGYAYQFSEQLKNLYNSQRITPNMIKYDSVGREYVEITGEFQLFDKETRLEFIIINFENQQDLRRNVGNYHIGASFDSFNYSYEIVCPAVNWILDSSILQPMLHHEMVHNYQLFKMKRDDLFTSKDRQLYNKAQTEKNKGDEFTNACSEVIYFSNKVEISAYANQLYSELTSNERFLNSDRNNQIRIVMEGEVSYTMNYFKYCLEIMKEKLNDSGACDYCLKTYNIPLPKLIKKGEKYYKYFQKRFQKAFMKALNDIEIAKS